MSNKLYPQAKLKLTSGQIDLSSDTLKLALVKNTYSYSAAHATLADLGSHVLGSEALTGVALAVSGEHVVLSADNVRFEGLEAGNTCRAVVLFKDTGTASTSPLIAIYDTGMGLPFVTSGSPQIIEWSATDKVLKW